MKVFINPGHAPNGEPDPGAISPFTGVYEADIAWTVGQLVAQYLNAAGVETETLQSDSLEEIAFSANSSDADAFVSIHCNSFGNPNANGVETWVFDVNGDNTANGSRAEKLGQCIQAQILDTFHQTDRGVKYATIGEDGLYVLTNTDMPACLVELGFISNPREEELMRTKQDEYARAIARGVTDYQQALS